MRPPLMLAVIVTFTFSLFAAACGATSTELSLQPPKEAPGDGHGSTPRIEDPADDPAADKPAPEEQTPEPTWQVPAGYIEVFPGVAFLLPAGYDWQVADRTDTYDDFFAEVSPFDQWMPFTVAVTMHDARTLEQIIAVETEVWNTDGYGDFADHYRVEELAIDGADVAQYLAYSSVTGDLILQTLLMTIGGFPVEFIYAGYIEDFTSEHVDAVEASIASARVHRDVFLAATAPSAAGSRP